MVYTQYCNVIEAQSILHVADKAYDTKVSYNEVSAIYKSSEDQFGDTFMCVYSVIQCSITCRTQDMLFNCASSLDNQVQI